MGSSQLKLGYLVSRFPTVTETFVLSELQALSRLGVETVAGALFPGTPPLHRQAKHWESLFYRPTLREALVALLFWSVRKPRALAHSLSEVVMGYGRHPRVAVRALATLVLACAHARRFQQAHVHHIHAHWATYPALAAWLCRRLTGIPYTFTVHSHDLYLHQLHLREKASEAEAVLTVSHANRLELERLMEETPVHVVRCGLALSDYAFRPRTAPASGPISVLCVASLREVKGHRYLFEAIASPGEPFSRLQVDLVGDGPLRRTLEDLAHEKGIAGRVAFRGAMSSERVAKMLDTADIFILPSIVDTKGQREGLPVALIEALAVGVPTIGTRIGGVPELVQDEITGLLAAPGDAESLRLAIGRTVGDQLGAEIRSAAAREVVETEFDADRSARRFLQILDSLSGPRRPKFNAEDYWSDRLATNFDLRGTGHLAYSDGYNRWIYRAKEDVLSDVLDDLHPLSPALDIGSGTGWVVKALANRGSAVEGCDITTIAVERLRKSFPQFDFFKCSVGRERVPRLDAQYALVTMIDVAYHIVSDDEWRVALEEIARVVRPNGHLVVTDSMGPVDSAPSAHVRFRSERSWREATGEVGLEPIAIRPLFRWLSRERSASMLAVLPGFARGAIEYRLETALPNRTPHTRCATFVRR